MINSYIYPDHRFNIHIITLEYNYGEKPENILHQLNGIGWVESPIVRNPLIEIPGCMQQYSVSISSEKYNSNIVKATKSLMKQFGISIKVCSKNPNPIRY